MHTNTDIQQPNKTFLNFLLVVIPSFVIGAFCGYNTQSKKSPANDTIYTTIYDTITYRQPTPVDSTIVRYKQVIVPITYPESTLDSVSNREIESLPTIPDSVSISLPITQKHYQDSLYSCWISGYEPQLDSIQVYNKTNYIEIYHKQKRWSIGIQAGAGLTTKGLQPYVGIGISYNLFNF